MVHRLSCLSFTWILLGLLQSLHGAQPNFLFILVDDLGKMDLSCEGSTYHETPHIDALARRSMRFDQGYSACQVCSPSRASIQTGQYPARLGITDYIAVNRGNQPEKWTRNTRLLPAEYRPQLPLEHTTIAEALRSAGYHTFFAGKWHLGDIGFGPLDQGYDINIGGHDAGTPPGGFFSPYKNPDLMDGPQGEELPIRLASETANFIKSQAHGSRPFFAMLSFYSVHAPIQTTEQRWKKYRTKAETMGLTHRTQPRFLLDRTQEVRQIQDHPVYAGMMEALDDSVGLVLQAVQDSGLSDNTIIIFTSDNGGVSSGDGFATSCLPLRGGKGRQWEGGIRQPFYIFWPGVTRGAVCDVPVIGTDFFPTILEMAGLPLMPNHHMDGLSLVPLLVGKTIPDRALFWHYPHYGNQGGEPTAMIRKGYWKLIHYFEDHRFELYHIHNDPSESQDLSQEYPQLVTSLSGDLLQWQKSTHATAPEPNPDWDPLAHTRFMDDKSAKVMPRREMEHSRFLSPDFTPAGGWWQSAGSRSR